MLARVKPSMKKKLTLTKLYGAIWVSTVYFCSNDDDNYSIIRLFILFPFHVELQQTLYLLQDRQKIYYSSETKVNRTRNAAENVDLSSGSSPHMNYPSIALIILKQLEFLFWFRQNHYDDYVLCVNSYEMFFQQYFHPHMKNITIFFCLTFS